MTIFVSQGPSTTLDRMPRVDRNAATELIGVCEQTCDLGRQIDGERTEAYILFQQFPQAEQRTIAESEAISLRRSDVLCGVLDRYPFDWVLTGVGGDRNDSGESLELSVVFAQVLEVADGLVRLILNERGSRSCHCSPKLDSEVRKWFARR